MHTEAAVVDEDVQPDDRKVRFAPIFIPRHPLLTLQPQVVNVKDLAYTQDSPFATSNNAHTNGASHLTPDDAHHLATPGYKPVQPSPLHHEANVADLSDRLTTASIAPSTRSDIETGFRTPGIVSDSSFPFPNSEHNCPS